MSKNYVFHFGVACLTVLLFAFTGCQDKDYYDPDGPQPKPGDTKEASATDFSTTRSVEFKVNYGVENGYVSTYDVYVENPFNEDGSLKTDAKPITGGINISGLSKEHVLPLFASELYLHTTDLFLPKLMYAKVENGVAEFEPMAYLAVSADSGTRAIGSTNSGIDKFLTVESDYYLNGGWFGTAPYRYDLKTPIKTITFPNEVKQAINQAFPDDDYYKKKNLTSPNESYFKDAVVKILSDNGGNGVNIYVSLALADGKYRNSLSYFVYTDKNKDIATLSEAERSKLKLTNIFQLADMYNNPWKKTNNHFKNQGLTAGKAVKLLYVDNDGNYSDVFPVGAQIGFVIHVDAFNGKFNEIKNTQRIYSIANWNKNQSKQTVFFGAKDKKGNVYNFFGFEDQLQPVIKDCNDVMFHVLTDPVDAIDPPAFIPEFNTIEKTVSETGILAFEDNWPAKGDYDLNDVIVGYNSKITYVQDGQTTEESNGELVGYGTITVKRVEDTFKMLHTGASFNNGFSYKVNIDPSKIKEVKVTDEKGNTANYSVIPDGTGFIIDLCPNVKDVIPAMQDVATPAVYTVKMEFADKQVVDVDFENLKAPYNPFIIPENTSIISDMIEVHLPYAHPTQRVDRKLFGRYDDVSKPENDIYYAAEKGTYYPFALHLAGVESFGTTEGISIDNSYPKYTDWVSNGCGTNDSDWYLHPKKK